jgi:hypothetical protein
MSCFEQCPPCEGCAAKDKEIAALVDARDRLVPRLDREIARARARAEAAEAERDRLRGLLERLAACAQLRATPSWIEEIRAVLAAAGKEPNHG